MTDAVFQTVQRRVFGRMVDDDLERVWDEAVMIWSRNYTDIPPDNHAVPQ
jgi:hypothetical protein